MKLYVQKYLSTKSTTRLEEEFGIKTTVHPTQPLMILNYHQIDSPKTHQVVRECRGLVLHTETHEIVARAFNRFFNWGEVTEEMAQFDWSDFSTYTKEDGSLVLLFWFDGQWYANTRGSFGEGKVSDFVPYTWRTLIKQALQIDDLSKLDWNLDRNKTYICELCTPYNKVIRAYPDPKLYLLSIYDRAHHRELTDDEVDEWAVKSVIPFIRPERHQFSDVDGIVSWLQENAKNDATFEGVIVRDCQNLRYKLKSQSYLSLHRIRGDGENLFHPKHQIPHILSGNDSEFLTYFPEAAKSYHEHKIKVEEALNHLLQVWEQCWQIPDQKDFAIAIMKTGTPFTNLLFQYRKNSPDKQTAKGLEKRFREHPERIYKQIFERKSKKG